MRCHHRRRQQEDRQGWRRPQSPSRGDALTDICLFVCQDRLFRMIYTRFDLLLLPCSEDNMTVTLGLAVRVFGAGFKVSSKAALRSVEWRGGKSSEQGSRARIRPSFFLFYKNVRDWRLAMNQQIDRPGPGTPATSQLPSHILILWECCPGGGASQVDYLGEFGIIGEFGKML